MSGKKRLYRIEQYKGEIDTGQEFLHDSLDIDESDAKEIISYVNSEIMSSEPVNVSEILVDLLEKYYGAELVFAIYWLGWELGQMAVSGVIRPNVEDKVQEGYL